MFGNLCPCLAVRFTVGFGRAMLVSRFCEEDFGRRLGRVGLQSLFFGTSLLIRVSLWLF